jgi:hypothetical protein
MGYKVDLYLAEIWLSLRACAHDPPPLLAYGADLTRAHDVGMTWAERGPGQNMP